MRNIIKIALKFESIIKKAGDIDDIASEAEKVFEEIESSQNKSLLKEDSEFKGVQDPQTSAINKNYGLIERTEIIVDDSMSVKPTNWEVIKNPSIEATVFAKHALKVFLDKFGRDVGNYYNKAVIYFKSKIDKNIIYAARIERHQHRNKTEYGGAGKDGALMQPHPGVTIYKISG